MSSKLSKVWVFVEAGDSGIDATSAELITKARTLGEEVECFAAGGGAQLAESLSAYGVSKLFTINLDGGLVAPATAAAIAEEIDLGDGPDAILSATSYDGRDVIARLSVLLDRSVLTNVTEIEVDGDSVVCTEPVFGGETNVKTRFSGETPYLIAVRAKSFEAVESSGDAPEVEELDVPDLGAAGSAKVIERRVEETDGPKLDEAAVVVSGGRGLGDKDKFELIERLAKTLKGAPAATRAIVDAGWVPYAYQVGQTGKVVVPNVYIAAGISGATQHLVGMKGSSNIIAINKDPEAPIFKVADLGIVGDVHKVLPPLLELLEAR